MFPVDTIRSYFTHALAEAYLQHDVHQEQQLVQARTFLEGIDPPPVDGTGIAHALATALAQAEHNHDRVRLRELQTIAGVLMQPAEAHGHRAMAQEFRVLAAHAANAIENLDEAHDAAPPS